MLDHMFEGKSFSSVISDSRFYLAFALNAFLFSVGGDNGMPICTVGVIAHWRFAASSGHDDDW